MSRSIPGVFQRDPRLEAVNATEARALKILRNQAMTRADLASALDLSRMSVTRVADALLERGLIHEIGRIGTGKGPSIGLALVPDAAFAAGVSIMTDAASLALVNLQGEVVATRHERLPAVDRETVMALLKQRLDELVASHIQDPQRLFGVGVGITGNFVGDGTQVNPPAPLDDWALRDLEPELEASFDRPVWLDNDGNVAAMGEALYGAGQNHSSFGYLFFSAGFGGGVIQDGALLRGRNGNAGEWAGLLPRGYERPTLELMRQIVSEENELLPTINDLIERFDPSWSGIEHWLDRTAPAFNLVVSAASAVLDTDAIVLGGRMPAPLAERLINRVTFINIPRRGRIRPEPTIIPSMVKGDATAIGAAATAFSHVFFA